jgi:DNA-binding MarR family transcriptional regulator
VSLSDRFEPPRRTRTPASLPQLLRRRPGLLLPHVGARAARLFEDTLASDGIDSREFAALAVLVMAEGSVPQQAIGARLSRDRSTVMRLVTTLESKGLAERRRDPTDRRINAVKATQRGTDIFRFADANLEAAELELFRALPVAETRQLLRTLEWLA